MLPAEGKALPAAAELRGASSPPQPGATSRVKTRLFLAARVGARLGPLCAAGATSQI